MAEQLVAGIVDHLAEFIQLRRDLHAHPELSYEEHRTSHVVAGLLRSWGLEVHTGLAGTGVVGVLRGGEGVRSIGLRADMDGLPVTEVNDFAHASRHQGKMHACGHDGHTVMLLAAARHLAHSRGFRGTVHFIFQPAEERGAGARKMIDEGLFERFPCDAVFALHNWPGLPAGSFAARPGPMMAGTAGFEVVVSGRSCHAAMPHLGTDPIMIACQLATAFQLMVTRELNPVETAVLSVTQIHAGEAMNVIAESAVLKGTVRAFREPVFDQIEAGMQRVATQVSAAFGATAQVKFSRNYPPTVNDAGQTGFAIDVMRRVAGAGAVDANAPLTLASEDFAYMLEALPGCYALLGNGDGGHRMPDHGGGPCVLHNGSYDFNDDLIAVGASYWVRLAEEFLHKPPPAGGT